eukprot:CAMPEP_0116044860 /NCGR_PEP_ID=MMETSP0321-20121206/27261_1 /TAXON_ID=163516 /ORGANISM="Leptocylindrus danicus var. danicus, Strain B650" /LENGTH=173 /DNA_ID=CAMNT_0003526057 /DNA_START=48 /DNA_END=569 /DNA_ORIENTATION=-
MVTLTRNAKIITFLLICAVVTVGSLLLTMNGGSNHLRGGLSEGDNNANSSSSNSSKNSQSDNQQSPIDDSSSSETETETETETLLEDSSVDNEVAIDEEDSATQSSNNGSGEEKSETVVVDEEEEPVENNEPVVIVEDEPVTDEPKEVKLNPNGPWPECLGIHSDECVSAMCK